MITDGAVFIIDYSQDEGRTWYRVFPEIRKPESLNPFYYAQALSKEVKRFSDCVRILELDEERRLLKIHRVKGTRLGPRIKKGTQIPQVG